MIRGLCTLGRLEFAPRVPIGAGRHAVVLLMTSVLGVFSVACVSSRPDPERIPETSSSDVVRMTLANGAAASPAGPSRAIGPPAEPGLASPVDGGGEAVWVFEGLIAGLDGELYEGYLPVTIERTQAALRRRGLYQGPVNGILDRTTMRAIYAFQDASYGLQRCGVPTPRTRMLLEQGSHT